MKKRLTILFLITNAIFSLRAESPENNKTAEIVATCLILEAGGERDSRSLPAVLEVIRNRSNKSHKSLDIICLQRKQFSCFNNVEISQAINKAKKHPKYNFALDLVNKNKITNYTLGATHYHNLKVNPSWANPKNKTVKIENHIFYKLY